MTTSPARAMNEPESAMDVALITQVVLAERQGRDRGWWDQMLAAYWPDSTVRLSWYTGDGAGFVASPGRRRWPGGVRSPCTTPTPRLSTCVARAPTPSCR